MVDPLEAVSPLDGRYASRMTPLRQYVSEAALMRARLRVEVEYLVSLADVDAIPLDLDEEERSQARACYEAFDIEDAHRIKTIETEGTEAVPATNHDVKAIEYFLREQLRPGVHPWIHFALTSEDVTNLAYRLLVQGAVLEVLLPAITEVVETLVDLARDHRDLPMLARTHGQPATPTTFGKEMAVFVSRLDAAIDGIEAAIDGLQGKLGGASGTYAAHVVAYPDVEWRNFARDFVEGFGLNHVPVTTQINPGDDLATVCCALRRANQVVVDLDRDAWRYVSDRYLGQRAVSGETGSSTMPHKVNPIDFENAEGNLEKATSDLDFLARAITTSRLQRDLSDSTVKRSIGTALAHCLLGYSKTSDGLSKVTPAEEVMRADLDANPMVLAEAIQTVLRREGHPNAYERVKELTRGREPTLEELRAAIEKLPLEDSVREELRQLSPADYTGIADALVDELDR